MNDYSDREFKISVVLAMTEDCAIGRSSDNCIPWDCKPDRENFFMITRGISHERINLMVMGSKTFESLPEKMKTEGDKFHRHRLILSRSMKINEEKYPKTYVLNTTEQNMMINIEQWVFEKRKSGVNYNKIYYIGGAYYLPRILESDFFEFFFLTVIRDNDPGIMDSCDVKINNPLNNPTLETLGFTWGKWLREYHVLPLEYKNGVYVKYILKRVRDEK